MKNTRLIFSLSLALLFVAVSCNDDDFVEYGNEFFQEVTDPYLQILTPVISFQAGTPSYEMRINVVNGSKRITDLTVYSVFTDAASGMQSNEVVLKTYPLEAGQVTTIVSDLTYADLKAGLTVNGAGLPDDEVDLAIGSGWLFRFVGRRGEGDIPLAGNVRVSVLSRFAGIYRVVEGDYFRIGVPTNAGAWVGQTRFIGSVDATTFSYNDFWGPFVWTGNSFRFSLDESDNSIDVPILVNGALFSGNRALNCNIEPGIFVNVPCDGSNILIPDDVNGKHRIILTYGYFTDADGGAREFYEVLEKL
jgi:hypothetical protein